MILADEEGLIFVELAHGSELTPRAERNLDRSPVVQRAPCIFDHSCAGQNDSRRHVGSRGLPQQDDYRLDWMPVSGHDDLY